MARTRPRKKDAPAPHDRTYKRFFSHPAMVRELLRGFLDGDGLDRLDFSTLERVGNSFVSEDLRERHGDLIWRLRLRGEGEEDGWVYVYLLLEFQSASDPFMAVRLLTYVGLLLEEIVRREGLKPGDRLPAVLPLVLHSGHGRWRAPLRLETLFAPVPAALRRHLPRLTYLLLDERRLDLDRPGLEGNPAAAFFRLETNEEAEAVPRLYRQLRERLPASDPELLRSADAWFHVLVQRFIPGAIIPEGFNLGETFMSMLEENFIRWQEQARQRGLKEGLKEGRREGEVAAVRRVLLAQMTERFGPLPEEVRTRVEQITSIPKLERLTTTVLSAASLEDMGLGRPRRPRSAHRPRRPVER
jgi:hypothetical protein